MLFNLQFFAGSVYPPPPPTVQPHAQSLFLLPIVLGINLIHFFDGKNNCATWESRNKEGENFWQRKLRTHCEFQRHNGDHLRRVRHGRRGLVMTRSAAKKEMHAGHKKKMHAGCSASLKKERLGNRASNAHSKAFGPCCWPVPGLTWSHVTRV